MAEDEEKDRELDAKLKELEELKDFKRKVQSEKKPKHKKQTKKYF